MKLKMTLLFLFCVVCVNAQKWVSTLPPNPEQVFKSAVVYGYIDDYIYASGNDGVQYYNHFIFSSDKGKMVLSGHYNNALKVTSIINLKKLEKGVYILQSSKGFTKKIVLY